MTDYKCPLNRGRYPFEGGDKCQVDCAWRLKVDGGQACSIAMIAAVLASKHERKDAK